MSNAVSPERVGAWIGVVGRLVNKGRRVDGLRGDPNTEPILRLHEGGLMLRLGLMPILALLICSPPIDSASPKTELRLGDTGGDPVVGEDGGEYRP